MNGKVWLIGGTSDSVAIANILLEPNIPLVITVATATAQNLYSGMSVIAGCMDESAMHSFCHQHQIKAIVDASHPYAVMVSRQAIAVAKWLAVPYLRYERASYRTEPADNNSSVVELDSFEHLLNGDYLINERVLLTIGCKALSKFDSWQSRATLFARVLPKIESLKTAIAAGFTSDRLIAIRPPISIETETALWQQWQISLAITKASGKAGGEDIKCQVAASLGIPLIVIARPQVIYPQQTSEVADILPFCRRSLNFSS